MSRAEHFVWDNLRVALEPILRKIDEHISEGSELMAATRETLHEVRLELQLSREIHLRQLDPLTTHEYVDADVIASAEQRRMLERLAAGEDWGPSSAPRSSRGGSTCRPSRPPTPRARSSAR